MFRLFLAFALAVPVAASAADRRVLTNPERDWKVIRSDSEAPIVSLPPEGALVRGMHFDQTERATGYSWVRSGWVLDSITASVRNGQETGQVRMRFTDLKTGAELGTVWFGHNPDAAGAVATRTIQIDEAAQVRAFRVDVLNRSITLPGKNSMDTLFEATRRPPAQVEAGMRSGKSKGGKSGKGSGGKGNGGGKGGGKGKNR